MTRRRSAPSAVVSTAELALTVQDSWSLFDALGVERPATVRVWRRPDGITVRALGRTADGMRVSAVVKLRTRG